MEVTTTGDGGGGCICASCTLPIVISVCATALVSVIVCTLICCCCCKRRKSSEPARKVGEEAGAVEETERLHVCQQCGKKAWKSVADGGGSDNNAYEEDVGSTGVVSVTVVNEKSSMGDIMGDGKKATPNPYVNMPIGTQGTNASEGMKNVDNNEKHEDTHEHGDTQKLENVVKIEVTEPMKSDEHVYNESERDIEVKGGYENEITISEEVQEVQTAEHDERGIGVADHRLSSAQDYIEIEPVEGIHAQSHQTVYENLEGGGVVGVSGHKETYPQLVDEASERQDEIREGGSRADEDDAVTVKVDMRDTEVTSKLEETTEAHSEIQLVNEATERLHADRRRADELDAIKVDMPDREVITTTEEMMEERSEIQLVYGNTEILYADKSRAGEVDTVRVTVDTHDMEENSTFEVTAESILR
ncbi:uncharacterized protein [Ptychodera flava]|uniref:uncharacterized protein n=1 Tax=Ptychodera flava TaxID=63121 RepID=UPI00396A9982